MPNDSRHLYEFGPFRLDPAERQLRRGDTEIPLTPKAFDILLTLVTNAGRTITKEEFMAAVWPDAVVEEANLSDNIFTLRQALGDDAREPKYIRTIPKRGYRFVAEVRDGARDAVIAPVGRTNRLGSATFAIALLAVIGALVWFVLAKQSAPRRRHLAVLPFRPLVASTSDPALELGITDALITKLSNIREFAVRPTTAVLRYSGESDLRKVAKALEADVVLDGKIQRAGERIRLSVQLVQGSDGSPLWADTFDEKFTDIFEVQDEVSRRVASRLAVKLGEEERGRIVHRDTRDARAYELYLQGRYFWNKRTEDSLKKAIEFFRQATERDPGYALAYSGLADSYILLGRNPLLRKQAYPAAKDAALEAVRLDGGLAEAHTSLGQILRTYDHDLAGSEKEFQKAIEINPGYATAHHWYSRLHLQAGRMKQSVAESRKALELDPVSLIINLNLAESLYFAREFDESLESFHRIQEMDSAWRVAEVSSFMALLSIRKGNYDEGARQFAHALSEDVPPQREREIAAALFDAHRRLGPRGFWNAFIQIVQKDAAKDPNLPIHLAVAFAQLGENDQAITWLDRATDAGHPGVLSLHVDPDFDTLRSDPRFAGVVARAQKTWY